MPELRLEIDTLRLDEEWQAQPKQRQIWGELLADAQFELDEAKSALDMVRAETDREIREDPEAFGVGKVTESAISTAVIVHPAVKVSTKKLHAARHTVNVLQAAVDGLEHRKRALSMLVELHGQSYYSDTPTRMPAGVKNKQRREDKDDNDDG